MRRLRVAAARPYYFRMHRPALAAVALALLTTTAAAAQPSPGPQPLPLPQPIPAPQDLAYPGVMRLEVDATDNTRRIFRVRQTIPLAAAGRTTLLYPAWLPGNHAPRGPLDKLSGLVIRAGGQVLPWTRDPVDPYAFHVDAPQGATALDLEFQFVSPTAANQGRVVVTPEMLNLQWNAVALYPAGYFTRRIMVEPSVRLPEGWKFGVALDTAGEAGGVTRFQPVDFETLVDSPMFAGLHFRQLDLDPGGRSPVRLNIVADRPDLLEARPEQIEAHRQLVRQADRLFGTRPFDRYDFLLSLSDRLGGIGLEHHRSSENRVIPGYFTDWAKSADERDLLPHEYTHAWNGKYRRPAELWTPNFNVPMRGSLLWVYEGQTQYWGYVLSGRSGLMSRQDVLDALALTAAIYENRAGRQWRQMEDTTLDPIIARRSPQPWTSWQRAEDYYSEGQLIWLDADTLIRERSGGRRSLDDFARAFFAGKEGDRTVAPYAFEDVVAALNRVEPYDWAAFLQSRVRDVAPRAPLDGLARGGYRLTYTETPTDYFKALEGRQQVNNLSYSLGLVLNRDGDISAVQWDGPAFNAGLAVGGRIMAVNGIAYSADGLKDAVTAAKAGGPLSLIVRTGDHFRTVAVDYRGGLRYPRLERVEGTPDRLTAIYAPKR
jgi:predicted metalloprotease with PDZ domain